jgi:2-oxoglutarate dehydrogenase E2 component (dihydrolipoamide succinyltransferase)
LIADAMVNSKKTSPHVTSFIETDVTNVVKWRAKHKDAFEKRRSKTYFYANFRKSGSKSHSRFSFN